MNLRRLTSCFHAYQEHLHTTSIPSEYDVISGKEETYILGGLVSRFPVIDSVWTVDNVESILDPYDTMKRTTS